MGEKSPTRRLPTWVWLSTVLLGAFAVRFSLFDFESGDYRVFLSPWYDFIASHGGFRALKHDFCDYSLLYLYLLVMATWLPISKIYAIKLISVLFDYLAAYFVFRIVALKYGKGSVAYAAGGIALFLPSMVLNSAAWGQCDVIYAVGFLACLFWTATNRPFLALVAYGTSCALKPQAVFLLPFLGGLMLARKIRWRFTLIPPAVYLLAGIPALLVGKPPVQVLLGHTRLRSLPQLTLGATNWFQWLSNDYYGIFYNAGLVMTAVASLLLALSMQSWAEREDEKGLLVSAALLSTLVVPYFLPSMHERYFFPADVLSLIYAFWFPRRILVPVLIQCASFFTYFPFLFNTEPVPRPVLAFLISAAMGLVVGDYVKKIWHRAKEAA